MLIVTLSVRCSVTSSEAGECWVRHGTPGAKHDGVGAAPPPVIAPAERRSVAPDPATDRLSYLLARVVEARRPAGPILQRDVGFEFQMLKTFIEAGGASELPITMDGWHLEADGQNLEFVVEHTDDVAVMKRRMDEVDRIARSFREGIPITPDVVANHDRFEAVRQGTTFKMHSGQPQINADMRLDDVDRFFERVDQQILQKDTSADLEQWLFAKLGYMSNDELAGTIAPDAHENLGVEIAKVRGLVRLMYQDVPERP